MGGFEGYIEVAYFIVFLICFFGQYYHTFYAYNYDIMFLSLELFNCKEI